MLGILFLFTPEKKKAKNVQKEICTRMSIAALYIIFKIWKQTMCPLIGEGTSKLWYRCSVECCYSYEQEWIRPDIIQSKGKLDPKECVLSDSTHMSSGTDKTKWCYEKRKWRVIACFGGRNDSAGEETWRELFGIMFCYMSCQGFGLHRCMYLSKRVEKCTEDLSISLSINFISRERKQY